MRTVARFQLSSKTEASFDSAVKVLQDWKDEKSSEDNGLKRRRRDGATVQISERYDELGKRRIFRMMTEEPTASSTFQTISNVLLSGERAMFQSDIRTGDPSGAFGPLSFRLSAPKYIHGVLQEPIKWCFGLDSDRVFAKAFVLNEDNYDEFEDLLISEKRRLPIVLLSDYDSGNDILCDEITRVGAGLVHVCRANEDFCRRLTRGVGKEWSCFEGALRIYWPRKVLRSSPFHHPLYTRQRLLSLGLEGSRLRGSVGTILAPIFESSAYLPGFDEISTFLRELERARFERSASEAREADDNALLAHLYAEENDRLKNQIQQLEAELQTANSNLAALYSAPSSLQIASAQPEDAAQNPRFETIREAVLQARSAFDRQLVFSEDLLGQLKTISPDALPPEKIWRYFSVLSALSTELRKNDGRLGMGTVEWLKKHGLECSGESETKKGSGLYSWQMEGHLMEFELHLKPSDATAPDKCVRIYFKPSNDFQNVYVGYVGSKKGL